MDLERLAALERELVTRNIALHPDQYRRAADTVSQSGAVIRGFSGHLSSPMAATCGSSSWSGMSG